jgi:hypothetical protein
MSVSEPANGRPYDTNAEPDGRRTMAQLFITWLLSLTFVFVDLLGVLIGS